MPLCSVIPFATGALPTRAHYDIASACGGLKWRCVANSSSSGLLHAVNDSSPLKAIAQIRSCLQAWSEIPIPLRSRAEWGVAGGKVWLNCSPHVTWADPRALPLTKALC